MLRAVLDSHQPGAEHNVENQHLHQQDKWQDTSKHYRLLDLENNFPVVFSSRIRIFYIPRMAKASKILYEYISISVVLHGSPQCSLVLRLPVGYLLAGAGSMLMRGVASSLEHHTR